MNEDTEILTDRATTPRDKNAKLNDHINGPWNNKDIIKIERVESGWRVTYRVENQST
jgi:hypothetical protein